MLIQPIQNYINFQGLGNKILVEDRRNNDYPQRHYENYTNQNNPQPKPEIVITNKMTKYFK